jgi:hypothetical protein
MKRGELTRPLSDEQRDYYERKVARLLYELNIDAYYETGYKGVLKVREKLRDLWREQAIADIALVQNVREAREMVREYLAKIDAKFGYKVTHGSQRPA